MTLSIGLRAVAPGSIPDVDDVVDPGDVSTSGVVSTSDVGGVPADLARRRRRAVRRAADDAVRGARSTDPDSWTPSVALCRYAPGCVAMAVAGRPNRADVEHLRALGREVDRLAAEELVVDCSRLEECGPGLVRTLAGLRVRRLSAGARVEIHDPPPDLRAAVGPNPASAYDVVDAAPPPRRARGR